MEILKHLHQDMPLFLSHHILLGKRAPKMDALSSSAEHPWHTMLLLTYEEYWQL